MNALVSRIEPQQDQQPASSIDQVLAAALSQDDVDLDRVERFLALKREYEADEARKAYVAAMAKFKAKPLAIVKDKHVKFTTQKGVTEYDHATIGNVVKVICAGLGSEGFSHRWDTKQDAGKITVTCVITHERGHSESTALTASPDDSGGKNGIQSIASTVTYLQRYTLLAATGMATSDQDDDDGRTGELSEADRIVADWKSAIQECVDVASLEKRRAELVTAYGSKDKVPADLKKLCLMKKAELEQTA
jgi:hypothetical protein